MTRACKREIRKKKRAYNRARRSGTTHDWEYFRSAASNAKKSCRQAYNSFVRDSVSPNIKHNPKRFFSYIKSKKCDNVGVSPLRDQGSTYISDSEKARILNNQFASVFSKDDQTTPTMSTPPATAMPEISIDTAGVKKLMKELNPFKASGPDGVTARFLKETFNELAAGMTLVFAASIHQSTIPDAWRDALVVPSYKPGKSDRGIAENYRPISLTSISCKLLEHIIHSHIIQHFDSNNILTNTQHGFRKKRSCETQLITTIHDLAKGLNDGQQIDSILLDFSKAFDKVCHRKLCLKLEHYGVRGKCLEWVKDFLGHRTQRVVVGGQTSSAAAVESGVPQGTVLGPLLFLAYINDMPEKVRSTIGLFADDGYIYRVIQHQQDSIELQKDLDALVEWEKAWSMEFHPDKCKVLRITNKRKIIDSKYIMHGTQLEVVDQEKYLGVILHKKLSWKPHINKITAKANQTRQFLQRNLRTCDKEVKLQCYKTYVRPIVEYACAVWDPSLNKGLCEQVESVQRKAARFIHNDWRRHSSPTKMIQQLQLQSLEQRRSIAKLNLMHGFIHGAKYIPPATMPERARSRDCRFKPMYHRVIAYQTSFMPSTVVMWNKLPANIVNIECPFKFNNILTN